MIMMGVSYDKMNMPVIANLNGEISDSKDIAQAAVDAEFYVVRSNLAAMGIGDTNQAVQYADVAIKLNSKSPTAWYQRGHACITKGGMRKP